MEALELDFQDLVASEDDDSADTISEDLTTELLEEIGDIIAEYISTISEDADDTEIDELLDSEELAEKVQKVLSAKARGMSSGDIRKAQKAAAKYYKKNKSKLKKKGAKYRAKVQSGARKVVKRVLVKHNDPSDSEDAGDDELSEELDEIESDMFEFFTDEEIEFLADLTEDEINSIIESELDEEDVDEAEKKVFVSAKKRYGASKAKKMAKAAKKYRKSGAGKKAAKRAAIQAKKNKGKKKKFTVKKVVGASYDPAQDVDALIGDSELSEEFKTKATTIFEAAVNREVEKRSDQLDESFEEALVECTEEAITDITDQVDSYLNHIAEEWLSLNEMALTSGIKSDLSENLLTGIKELFDLHYIQVPEEKVNVVEEFAGKIEDLEQRLTNQMNENIALKSQLEDKTKLEVVSEMTFDLVETETEKLKELADGVDFTGDVEDYKEKISVIKESYFGGNPTSTHDDVDETDEPVQDLTESMSIYTDALTRSVK